MAEFFNDIQIENGLVTNFLNTDTAGQIVTTTKGDLLVDHSGNNTRRFPVGASGNILIVTPNNSFGVKWGSPTETASGVVSTIIRDRRPVSTTGGEMAVSTWVTRHVNDLVDSEGGTQLSPSTGGISLVGSQIQIPKGVYFIIFLAPAFRVNEHQTRAQQIAGTSQINTITTGAASTFGSSDHFFLFSRSLQYSIWYSKNGGGSAPTIVYGTSFATLKIDVDSADTATQVATKTASTINTDASANFFFTASSSGNIVTVTNNEVGPVTIPTDAPGGNATGFSFAIDTSGTLTTDTLITNGSSGSTGSASQGAAVTSNIFYRLILPSSAIIEFQHIATNTTGIQDLGVPSGLSSREIYTNMIFHKIG